MPIQHSSHSGGSRGCGSRKAGGVYLCTGLSEFGSPLEAFLIDPVVPFDSIPGESFRTPILRENPYLPGVMDAYVWVGEQFYPSIVDYVEETRVKGASRRVSPLLDLSQLTPGKSRMIFIHPKAFTKHVERPLAGCPKEIPDHESGDSTDACMGAQWQYAKALGSDVDASNHGRIGDITFALPEQLPAPECSPGLFMALPVTHIEYESTGNDADIPEVVNKCSDRGFDVFIMHGAEQ